MRAARAGRARGWLGARRRQMSPSTFVGSGSILPGLLACACVLVAPYGTRARAAPPEPPPGQGAPLPAGPASGAGIPLGAPRQTVEPARPPAPGSKGRQPHKVEQLTREQFERLGDDEEIEANGRRIGVGELRARRRQAEAEAPAREKAAAEEAGVEFEARRARFMQEQDAKREAANARALAEAERWQQQHPRPTLQPVPRQPAPGSGGDGQLEAIRHEARQLLERSKSASPSEVEQIEARAGELLKQVERLKGAGRLSREPLQPRPPQDAPAR